MKSQNNKIVQKEVDNRIVCYVTLMAIVIVVLFFIRLFIFSSGNLTYDEICSIEFGENWVYEYNDLFGKTCVEINYISLEVVNRTEFNWTNEELVNKYCPNKNSFMNLRKWKNGCGDWRGNLK